MKIWIDTQSGTWGDADYIVIVEAPEEMVDELDAFSDSEIRQFARGPKGAIAVPFMVKR